jgi:16S rRNA C967 or C1407 C5-methylase (RsmB/RsmF family)
MLSVAVAVGPQVLDMCAAPGSKTFQLLEMLHDMDGSATGSGASAGSSQLTPTGFVVANDADAQRCNLLTHQTKRMCSPCLMVTNHEAQAFPRIRASLLDKPAPGSAAAAAAAVEAAVGGGDAGDAGAGVVTGRVHREDTMLFDRILADVPCSGDGTMRKAPDIWRRWSVNNGNGLHNLQLRIALQAARLLKVRTVLQVQSLLFQPCKASITDPLCGVAVYASGPLLLQPLSADGVAWTVLGGCMLLDQL